MSVIISKPVAVVKQASGFKLAVFLLVYHTFVSTSLILPLLGVSNLILVLTNFFGILSLIVFHSRRIEKWAIILIFLIIFFTVFKVMFFHEFKFFKINLFLITSVLLVSLVNIAEIKRFIDISSKFILIVLIGAIAAFILHNIGLNYVFTYVSQSGREHYFYYTSFGHSFGKSLRACGIYDEPGTLAFMAGGLLVLRRIFSLNQKLSITILFFTFITFSLAFLIFSIIYITTINLKRGQITGILTLLVTFMFIINITGFINLLEDNLFTRFTLNQDERQGIRGGRETLFWNAYYNLTLNDGSILWGVNPYCTINAEECLKKGYMGENPLAPIAEHGIFIAWPYYIFILICLFISIRGRRYLIFLALMSLFLQRPYLLNYGVSLLGIMPIYLFFMRKKYNLKL